ncbi:MAG: InlB B-repeat-containing protein [Planctomycetota bacterium]
MATPGGSIAPAGATAVNRGNDLTLTASPGAGYIILAWSVDGTEVQRGGTSFTLSDIFADHTVEVVFAQLQYTITASAGPHGIVSPLETDVHDGGNHKFTATPAIGYQVGSWFLDGTETQFGGTTYEVGPVHSDHMIYVIFEKTLSYSLGTLDFDDEQEYEDSVVSNNEDLPDEALVLIEAVGLGQDPDNLAMVLHSQRDQEGKAVNARAKGTFIKTGADEVLIRFKYLFTTSNVELVVYLSDSPLLMAHGDPLREQHYIEAARLAAPPYPRPGSPESERFAVFQKIVWTGGLDFAEGLYIELELVERIANGILLASLTPRVRDGLGGNSVYVDNWSTEVQCYGICLDINWDNFVDEADFLTVIGAYGCDATGNKACLEGAFSADGYVDSYDVASWDWAMNSDQRLLNYCGLPLAGESIGIQMMSAPSLAPQSSGDIRILADVPADLGDLLVVGKRGPASPAEKLRDQLYTFSSAGQCTGSFEAASNRGNIRLIQGPQGALYQLNSETGLLRLDSTDEVIVPPGKLEPADLREPRYGKPATVYVGIQGSDTDSFGRPVLDAAVDADHVYVVPVVVSPEGGQVYTAAAKLKLLTGATVPYELVELYDDAPLLNDNQYRDSLREIEVDASGNVYVLNVHALNESDILWRYKPNGTVERLDLGRPDGDTYVPAPIAMHVSKTTDMLYLASATTDPFDPESTVIYGFSTGGPITLEKSVVINGMQHVTCMAEDSRTGALWVAGFNMRNIPVYPNPTRTAFYYPHLARVSFDNDDVSLLPLFDPASHDLALPMSILWTGISGPTTVE